MAENQSTALSMTQGDAALAAIAATKNDLSQLTEEQRAQLYGAVCKSVGINPLTSPFEYIKLNGKLTLYAKKGATDQIRETRGISIVDTTKEVFEGVLMVTVTAQDKNGRTDSDVGAVVIKGLQGEALANAYMKAITKAKRRVTLSLAGLGFLDDSEVDSIPAERAQRVSVDKMTGVIEEIEPTPIALGEADFWNIQSRRLLDIVEGHGFTIEDLELYARDKGAASLSDIPGETLQKISDGFEQRPGPAIAHFTALRAKYAVAEPEPEIDPATGEIIPQTFQSEFIDMPDSAHVGHGEA